MQLDIVAKEKRPKHLDWISAGTGKKWSLLENVCMYVLNYVSHLLAEWFIQDVLKMHSKPIVYRNLS